MEDRAVAVVTDNLNYASSYQPFERPPDSISLYSLIPRGIRRFFLQTDISAKPVNDQIDVFVTATLPEGFAYLFTRFNWEYVGDTGGDWSPTVQLRMFNHIPGQPLGTAEVVAVPLILLTPSGNPARTAATVSTQMFAGPVWSTHAGTITFRAHTSNVNAAVAAAGFVISHVEFLEFDLTQAQRYWINTPYPVMQR